MLRKLVALDETLNPRAPTQASLSLISFSKLKNLGELVEKLVESDDRVMPVLLPGGNHSSSADMC